MNVTQRACCLCGQRQLTPHSPINLQVQEKFMLDLTDEQAIKEFQDLMKSAVENMWAPLFDKGHDIVQKFK